MFSDIEQRWYVTSHVGVYRQTWVQMKRRCGVTTTMAIYPQPHGTTTMGRTGVSRDGNSVEGYLYGKTEMIDIDKVIATAIGA